jgi:hypothetical protein
LALVDPSDVAAPADVEVVEAHPASATARAAATTGVPTAAADRCQEMRFMPRVSARILGKLYEQLLIPLRGRSRTFVPTNPHTSYDRTMTIAPTGTT